MRLAHYQNFLLDRPLIMASGTHPDEILPPPLLIVVAAGIAMGATWLGKQILDRMKDANFQNWVRWLVTVIGAVYFARAMGWL